MLRAMDRFEAAAAELASAPADLDRRLLPRQRGRHDADHPGVPGRASRRRRPAGRAHLAAHPRWPARRSDRSRHRARAGGRTGSAWRPCRWPECPSTTWPCPRTIGWRAGRWSRRTDLDGEPVLVVERADAPTAHDEIESYCAAMGARPRWITHAAVQVERVLDLVALGTGIGWLNSWQATRGRSRDGCRRPAAATGGAVRRVPRRLADRRPVRPDRRVRGGRARDLRSAEPAALNRYGAATTLRRRCGWRRRRSRG